MAYGTPLIWGHFHRKVGKRTDIDSHRAVVDGTIQVEALESGLGDHQAESADDSIVDEIAVADACAR
jgi:hypothetical protein